MVIQPGGSKAKAPASVAGRLASRTKYTKEYSWTAAAHIRPAWSAMRRTKGKAVRSIAKML